MATTKQTLHWIGTVNGYYALVDNEERDRLTPLGWQEVADPDPDGFVYMHKDGIEVPGAFACSGMATWQLKGWAPGPPPQRVDPTKDPVEAPAKTTKTKPATAADANPKE